MEHIKADDRIIKENTLNGFLYSYLVDDKYAGSIEVWEMENEKWKLENIRVEPHFKRQGIATKLIEYTMKDLDIPYRELNWGMQTEEGAKLKKALDGKYEVNSPNSLHFKGGGSMRKIPKELEPLAEEARKYKNVEEFARNIIPKYNQIQKSMFQVDIPEIRKKVDEFYKKYPGISKIMDFVPVSYEKGNALQDWTMQKIFGRPVKPGEAYPDEKFFDFYNRAIAEKEHIEA